MVVRRSCQGLVVAFAFTLVFGLAAPVAAAQDEKVNPTRPGETESPDVVSPGQVQIEVGVSFDHDTEGGETSKTSAFPSTLIRVGLIDRLELNLSSDGLVIQSTTGTVGRRRDVGTGDPVIGFRYHVADGSGWRPSAMIMASISLPAAGEPFGNGHSDFTVGLAASHSLGSDASFDWTMKYSGPIGEENDVAWQLTYATALGLDLTARLATYVEVFGDVRGAAGSAGSTSVGGGFIHYVGGNMSVDLSISIGLTGATEDLRFGFGFVTHL